jgi:hypothetical protein
MITRDAIQKCQEASLEFLHDVFIGKKIKYNLNFDNPNKSIFNNPKNLNTQLHGKINQINKKLHAPLPFVENYDS